jgi:hypothetical protein
MLLSCVTDFIAIACMKGTAHAVLCRVTEDSKITASDIHIGYKDIS